MALRDTQETLAGWIRAPEGVAAALAEEDAAVRSEERETALSRLEALIRADGTLDATGRLEIYANAYFHRILGVLAADFPALRDALGAAAFHDLVTSYILVTPSRHPSLRYAGLRLSNFIASHDAASGIRARSPWAAELARFEWARVDAFDAADRPVLVREALALLAPEKFGSLVLCLGPWVQICAFENPVDRLWALATHGEKVIVEAPMGSTSLLVWRKDEAVVHRRVEPLEEAALTMLGLGTRFDSLCEWAAIEAGESEAPAQAAGWLEQWIADGLLAATVD
jgi:hypothetical protein